jgi:phosphotransferase system IIA component
VIRRPIPYSLEIPEKYKHKLTLNAPVSGIASALARVSDRTLQSGVWGEGLAIETRNTSLACPVEGIIERFDQDAQRWTIKSKTGLKIMLLLGPVLPPLFAERLTVMKRQGARVMKGDIIAYFDPLFIAQHAAQDSTNPVLTPVCYCTMTVMNRQGVNALVAAPTGTRLTTDDAALSVYL